jgi:hypothetical protein
MMSRENARGSFRLSVTVPISVSVAGFSAPIPAILVNLSESGCRMTARSIFLTGSAIRFELPRLGAPALKLQGSVRNTEPGGRDGGGNEYGIEFLPLSRDDASALKAFIAQEQQRDANVLRVEADFPIQCRLPDQRETIPAVAIDVSRGGIRIEVACQLPEDGNVALRFTLPSEVLGPQAKSRPFREMQVEARLLRGSQRPRGEYHYSLLFVNPPAAFVEEIDRFVRATNVP